MNIVQADTAVAAFHAHQENGGADCQKAKNKSAVSGRRNELLADGTLEKKAKRKCRISGVTITQVGFPAGQRELFQ